MSDENKTLNDIVNTLISERKRDYRNKIIFRIIFILFFVFAILILPVSKNINFSQPHIAVIEINGLIASETSSSADTIVPLLKKASSNENSKAIVIKVNSGGGSATQSKIIFDEIKKLKKDINKDIISIIEDVGASGGYYIAMAADEVFASETSIVGSIGVRLDSYDVRSFFNKLGIKSRTIYSGDNKLILDPFHELTSNQYKHVKKLTDQIHLQFITDLKQSRKNRLAKDESIYSGLFYTGVEAKNLGLIDGISSIYDLKTERYDNIPLQKYNRDNDILNNIIKSSIEYFSRATIF
ncbi:MAG: S49 family peptidase [Gammaproteobacteria bacterium]|jgi:protease-4